MPHGDSFDERLLGWIDDHRIGALDTLATTMLHLNESTWFLVVVALSGLLVVVRLRAWRLGLAVVLASYLGGLASGLLKDHFERTRPAFPDALVQVGGYAMPSSHGAFMMAASIALLLVVRWHSRKTLALAASVIGLGLVLVGATMVYLGAHWATDVLAGWALGLPVGALVGLAFRDRRQSA